MQAAKIPSINGGGPVIRRKGKQCLMPPPSMNLALTYIPHLTYLDEIQGE